MVGCQAGMVDLVRSELRGMEFCKYVLWCLVRNE